MQVFNDKGYDGVVVDIWFCGVILFVLMVGFFLFDEVDLNIFYSKVGVVYVFIFYQLLLFYCVVSCIFIMLQ